MAGGVQIDRILPTNIWDALLGANAPSAANVFATMADIPAAATTIYTGNGTIGTTRVATLTDTLTFVIGATQGIGIGAAFTTAHAFEVRCVSSGRFVLFRGASISTGSVLSILNLTQTLATFSNNGFISISPNTTAGHAVAIGNTTGAIAKLSVTGSGATSATLNQLWRNSALTTLMQLNDNGYLGIGVAPIYRLQVQEDANNYMYFNPGGGEPLTTFSSTATITGFRANRNGTILTMASHSAGLCFIDANPFLDFYVGGLVTHSARINSSGNWGFGTSADAIAAKVDVKGNGNTNATYTQRWINSSTTLLASMNDVGQLTLGAAAPNAFALLDLQSTTKALKIMSMTAAQASAITPANGMGLYVTDTDATFLTAGFWKYEEGAWATW